MSSSNQPDQSQSDQERQEDTQLTSPTSSDMNLSTLDKIKRFFFSKEEWEAYLLERLEEEKRKKDGKSSEVKPREDSENKNVIAWIKTVFPSQEDANTFLKSQLEKLQMEKNELNPSTQLSAKPNS